MSRGLESQFSLRRLLLPVSWLALLPVALQLRQVTLPPSLENAICGPWGCGPRVMDVIAYQLFMTLMFTGATFALSQFVDRQVTRRVGQAAIMLGVCLILGLIGHELYTNGGTHAKHFIRRILFLIAVKVDLPILPSFASGFLARRCSRSVESVAPPAERSADLTEKSRVTT